MKEDFQNIMNAIDKAIRMCDSNTNNQKEYKNYMISIIRKHQHYPQGQLENMPFNKIKEIYEKLIDWIK